MDMSAMFDQWSNGACLGYVIDAMEKFNYKPEQIQKVVDTIKHRSFETLTVKEADSIYCNSKY